MKRSMTFAILFVLMFITGCWDRKEINDIGLVMATGIDLADNGKIKATIQIAVPSPSTQTAGSSVKTVRFFLISAVGKNGTDLDQKRGTEASGFSQNRDANIQLIYLAQNL